MIRLGSPPTRDVYLRLAYGKLPEQPLSAEEEADLPPPFRSGADT